MAIDNLHAHVYTPRPGADSDASGEAGAAAYRMPRCRGKCL